MMARLFGLPVISPAELEARLGEPGLAVFDVNAEVSWRRHRVPGARRLDHQHFGAGELPADRAVELVFYCSGPLCRKAPLAARRARALGFSRVRVLSAGISGWVDGGLPTEAGDGATGALAPG